MHHYFLGGRETFQADRVAAERALAALPAMRTSAIASRQFLRRAVTFLAGERPNGQFDEPSTLLLADKAEFGSSRVRRWFNRDWRSY